MLTPLEIKKCEELVSHWNNEHGSNARTKKLGFRDPEIFGAKCCDLGMWPPRNVRCLGKTRLRLMVVAMCMLPAWRSSRGGGGLEERGKRPSGEHEEMMSPWVDRLRLIF
jgi:hypothetical protein